MIYIIGGPPRIGKSTLAERLSKAKAIPFVSADQLTVMLKPRGMPSYYGPRKIRKFFPYLKRFIDETVLAEPDYIIEGDAFSPKQIMRLKKKFQIKAVFLGTAFISSDELIKNQKFYHWADSMSQKSMTHLINRILKASRVIKKDCLKYNIDYFEISQDYKTTLDSAYKALAKSNF